MNKFETEKLNIKRLIMRMTKYEIFVQERCNLHIFPSYFNEIQDFFWVLINPEGGWLYCYWFDHHRVWCFML